MDANAYVGGNYLNARIVKSERLTEKNLLVVDVTEAEFQKKEGVQKKLCLHFAGEERGLVLNATNTKILINKFGSATSEWKNKLVRLLITKQSFQGDIVDSVLVNPDIEQPKEGVSTPSQTTLEGME